MKQIRRPRATPAHWQTALERDTARQLYPPGITLLRQGAPVQEIYVLQTGLVKLVHAAANGREVILGLRAAGDWLGLAAATLHEPAPCSAITLNSCELYRLPVAAYLNWRNVDQEFARQQHELLSQELHGHLQHAIDLVCASARQRLEQAFWHLAQAQTNQSAKTPPSCTRGVWLQLPFKQQELASWIAVTPSHLSRLFSELEEAKLLRRVKGWHVLTAPDKLWRARLPAP